MKYLKILNSNKIINVAYIESIYYKSRTKDYGDANIIYTLYLRMVSGQSIEIRNYGSINEIKNAIESLSNLMGAKINVF